MKFSKLHSGHYQATRADGQIINIENRNCDDTGTKYWLSSYEGDFDGDNNGDAKTKRELVAYENRIETSEEAMKETNTMEG